MKPILFLTIGTAFLGVADADTVVKRYTIESGEVHYQITGSGDVMGMKTKTGGKKSLLFKNYGTLQLEEERSQKVMSGTVNEVTKEHSLSKLDNTTIYSVDFSSKKIIASTDPVAINYRGQNMGEKATAILSGLGGRKIGTDQVLGYDCNIWMVTGAKECLYKDQVPLWIEIDIMGITTKHKATAIRFNQAIDDNRFSLPNYPLEKSPMLMSEADIKRSAMVGKAIEKTAKKAQQSESGAEKDSEKALAAAMLMMLGQDEEFQKEFVKMQQDLPKILDLAKQYRSCLQEADNKPAAVSCQKDTAAKAEKMGLEDDGLDESLADDLGNWSTAEKQKYLQELDQDLQKMEEALPCLQKAKNPVEIIGCPGFAEG